MSFVAVVVSLLPEVAYREEHGCTLCRDTLENRHSGSVGVPDMLIPVSSSKGKPVKFWTNGFQVCQECGSIWAIAVDVEGVMRVDPTPIGMEQALDPEAGMNELMVPLFARKPVSAMVEEGLWELDFDPQDLFDRLVGIWRHPESSVDHKIRVLQLLRALLSAKHTGHRELMRTRGWLIENTHGFQRDLSDIEDMVVSGSFDGGRTSPDVLWDLEMVNYLLTDPGVVRQTGPGFLLMQGDSRNGTKSRSESTGMIFQSGVNFLNAFRMTSELLTPFRSFLPAILWGVALVEFAVHRMAPQMRSWAECFLLMVGFCWYGAAIARNADALTGSIVVAIWRRLSVIFEYLIFCSIVSLLSLAAVVLMIRSELVPEEYSAQVTQAVSGVILALFALRCWPALVIPFRETSLYPEGSWSVSEGWRKSALIMAWKITGPFRVWSRFSTTWLVLVMAAGVAMWVVEQTFGYWLRTVFLYFLVLPTIFALSWAMVEELEEDEPSMNMF